MENGVDNILHSLRKMRITLVKPKRKRKPMTYVNLPNGEKRKSVSPAGACKHTKICKFRFNLLSISPEGGKKTRRLYRIINKQMKSTIVHHNLQEQGGGRFSSYKILSVYRICNPCLWRRFREKQNQIKQEAGFVNERLLFHGTPYSDVIIKHGFDRSKANPDGLFGPRIYFAEHSSKSNQYVYGYLGGNGCPKHGDKSCYVCPRKVLLCRVSLGKTTEQTSPVDQKLPGHHSVSGVPAANGSLRYPEYAVDHEDQVYPEYLITYTIVP